MKLATRRRLVMAGFAAACMPLVHTVGAANEFPNKPIRWIVPFPPGGSNDILGRYLGIKLTERLGQQVVIDNRGGANGIIGAELASRAAPDGYTVLMISTSYVMNAAVRQLPYDVEKSFDPIALIATSPNCIVVAPASGITSLADLVKRAKAKPGSIQYASTGVGGFNHFGGELFKKVAKIDMQMVPYKGGGPAMTDVMANQVPVMFSSITQALGNIRAGRLKVIAVGAEKRTPVLPDVPTVSESGFPGYAVAVWWGVTSPAGTPADRVEKLRRELTAVLEAPDTRKRLLADAAEPLSMPPADIRRMIAADVRKWREVAQVAGIRVPGAATAAR